MRRKKPLQQFGAILACLATAVPCLGAEPACRDGECQPHCPVRPGQFGYYATQWRPWPVTSAAPEKPGDAASPARPARSVVPGADEESPGRPATSEPATSGPAAFIPPGEQSNDGRWLERLVADADAVRLADPASREAFTGRLVAAMLSEPDPQARRAVLELAASFDTPAAEAICAGALEDPDPRVRLAACQVCADRRGPDGVTRLARRAREDADLGVRLRAVRTLGEIGDPAAVGHLVALLDDPDPAIQARAVAALERATGRGFGADVGRWKAWAANPQPVPTRWSLGGVLRDLF